MPAAQSSAPTVPESIGALCLSRISATHCEVKKLAPASVPPMRAAIGSLAKRVSYVSTSLPHRKRLSLGGIDCGLMLHLCVELGSEHDGEASEIEPHDQDDHRAERAVGRPVTAEVLHIQFKQHAAEQPQTGRQHRAPGYPAPLRPFAIGRVAIYGGERHD